MRINVKHIITSTKIRKVRVDMQFHTFSHFITPKEKRVKGGKLTTTRLSYQAYFILASSYTQIYIYDK
jgi:hypothetical protein